MTCISEEAKKQAIDMDADKWREPRWARAKMLAAAGYPEMGKVPPRDVCFTPLFHQFNRMPARAREISALKLDEGGCGVSCRGVVAVFEEEVLDV
jgi:hypothetical protein